MVVLRLRGGGGDGGVVATQRRYMRSTFKSSYTKAAGAKGANYGAGDTGGEAETCGSIDPRERARARVTTCALSDDALETEHGAGAIVADELGNLYNKVVIYNMGAPPRAAARVRCPFACVSIAHARGITLVS